MNSENLDRSQLVDVLGKELRDWIHDWLPNMVQNLPDQLLQTAEPADLLQQAKALILLQDGELEQELLLANAHGNRITYLSSRNRPGALAGILNRLPDEKPLVRARIFSSLDRRFIIDIFDFRDDQSQAATTPLPSEVLDSYVQRVAQLTGAEPAAVKDFLNAIGTQNRQYATQVLAKQFEVFGEVEGTDRCHVASLVHHRDHYLIVAAGESVTRELLQRASQFLGQSGIGIQSATCDDVAIDSRETAIVTLQLEHEIQSSQIDGLARLLMVDKEVVQRLRERPEVEPGDIPKTELLFAVARLIRSRLNVSSRFRLSLEEVLRVLQRYSQVTEGCLATIAHRFGHPKSPSMIPFVPQRDTSELTDRNVMQALLDLPGCLQKSNWSQAERQCLAFRIDPDYFRDSGETQLPFGVFYVYGNGYDGFHVRFRDIARGGMRLVRTRNREHYLFESLRLFNEAYDLAWAQNLKNKDIPEGGAKAVVMLKPGVDPSFAGRRFVDGLLDLILPQLPNGGYYPELEYLYLGPDENVSPELIDWIVENARARGYQYFNTFISSKPRLGINHKQYGVTSEGVVVFLDQCLREKGIDPARDQFSVKLTGGPDGDVGGNAIRFLIRDFGNRVRIVGIADGSGCAIDPEGLSHEELLRLVDAGLPIGDYRATLSSAGSLTGIETFEEQGLRNNMHFRVQSDVFLPCGGRPGSINQFNAEMFFDAQGKPSSSIVVEGANLFITPAAREHLAAGGVWIVKDSSANKCGVICSSLEILAGMMMTDDQFLNVKSEYVGQVIERLKRLARWEAVSLFQEQRRQPQVPLPELSVQVSRMILRLCDVVEEWMDQWSVSEWEMAIPAIRSHLPPVLIDVAGMSAWEALPLAYRKQFVSAMLGSQLVYREGCRNLELMETASLVELASQRMAGLAAQE